MGAHLSANSPGAKSRNRSASANPAARRAVSLNQGGTVAKKATAATPASCAKVKTGYG